MASTYSTNLKIELIATGEQSGTWGTTTNTNLGTALEQAIVGYGNPNFTTDADLTITLTDSNATQTARAFALRVTSGVSLTTTRNLIVPTIEKPYLIFNNTSGSQSIVVKTSAGTGVTVPNGARTLVYVDGTNVVSEVSNLPTLTLNSALAVSSGGTGASTLTSNNVILGNGTSAVQFVAPGTSGNLLTSNGTTWQSTAPSINLATQATGTLPIANGGTGTTSTTFCNLTTNVTGVLPAANGGYAGVSAQVFTSNGTFTIPAGITRVKVTVVGGGGGGGGSSNSGSCGNEYRAGAGGGGGGSAVKWLTSLTPGNTLSVTRGAGGAGGATGSGTGGTGGTSSVASGTQSITTISATGGAGGSNVPGSGGAGSSGDLNIGGQGGQSVPTSANETMSGGGGGSSILGGGGTGTGTTAGAGQAYGGGGAGGGAGTTTSYTGGAGADGVIIFEW